MLSACDASCSLSSVVGVELLYASFCTDANFPAEFQFDSELLPLEPSMSAFYMLICCLCNSIQIQYAIVTSMFRFGVHIDGFGGFAIWICICQCT